jgi:hypothetical protein
MGRKRKKEGDDKSRLPHVKKKVGTWSLCCPVVLWWLCGRESGEGHPFSVRMGGMRGQASVGGSVGGKKCASAASYVEVVRCAERAQSEEVG